YSCWVSLDGTAEIVASTRVDMSHWDHLQISTVFHDGQRRPGSPPVQGTSSEWTLGLLPAFAAETPQTTFRPQDEGVKRLNKRIARSPGKPLSHLVARDLGNGAWWFALSDGWAFLPVPLATWSPEIDWRDVQVGDFNGDGL